MDTIRGPEWLPPGLPNLWTSPRSWSSLVRTTSCLDHTFSGSHWPFHLLVLRGRDPKMSGDFSGRSRSRVRTSRESVVFCVSRVDPGRQVETFLSRPVTRQREGYKRLPEKGRIPRWPGTGCRLRNLSRVRRDKDLTKGRKRNCFTTGVHLVTTLSVREENPVGTKRESLKSEVRTTGMT